MFTLLVTILAVLVILGILFKIADSTTVDTASSHRRAAIGR